VDGGAWPFLVGGVICLVDSDNERYPSLLISRLRDRMYVHRLSFSLSVSTRGLSRLESRYRGVGEYIASQTSPLVDDVEIASLFRVLVVFFVVGGGGQLLTS
jgi:hypothetical protein